jgi:hypothetical protein
MEAAILEIEDNIARIEALFTEADFHRKHGQQMTEINEELASEKERLSELFNRWEELEAIRSGQEQTG